MILLSLAAAASVAVQPLEPAAEADMRCVAAMLFAIGDAMDQKDDKAVNMFLASTSYFIGKLDGRVPGVDYRAHIGRLSNSAAFEKQVRSEISRCALEAGNAMQAVGKAAGSGAD